MIQYLDMLKHVLEFGEERLDRTGVGTTGVFGYQTRFNLQECFPAVTTKRLPFKSVLSELLWFLEGSDDERRLAEILFGKPRAELTDKRTIWTANAENQGKALGYPEGKLGPVYGVQWRQWTTFEIDEINAYQQTDGTYDFIDNAYAVDENIIDQIANVIQGIKTNPFGRRHIISAWNVAQLEDMALPPCHCFAQFHVTASGKLSCQLYQRSADVFLGVPFNIASYALLTHMIAQVCGLEVGEFVWTGGDVHIYSNHKEQVAEQLLRTPMAGPQLVMDKSIMNIDDFKMEHFKLEGYDPMPTIIAPMAV